MNSFINPSKQGCAFMKILCCLFLCCFCLISYGQSHNETEAKLKKTYTEGDFFALDRQFDHDKNSLSENVRLYYQAILSNAFNQCDESNKLIGLWRGKQDKQSPDSIQKDMLNMEADNFVKLYEYKKAADCYAEIIKRCKNKADSTKIAGLENSKSLWKAIASVPKQEVIIAQTTTVSWKRDKIGLIQIPMNSHGATANFVFDTGANLSVITESSARKLGLKIYPVNLDLSSSMTGKSFKSSMAVADSLWLGKVLIKNVVFMLLPDAMLHFQEGDYQQEGIIGEPVIAQLKQMVISQNGNFTVLLNSPGGQNRNMALYGLTPIVNFEIGNDKLPFRFDTGASTSVFYQPFFDKYKSLVLRQGTPHQLRTGGVGGTITESPAYTLSNFALTLAGRKLVIPSVNVRTSPVGQEKDIFFGNLGQDLFGKMSSLTIDFGHMFVKVE